MLRWQIWNQGIWIWTGSRNSYTYVCKFLVILLYNRNEAGLTSHIPIIHWIIHSLYIFPFRMGIKMEMEMCHQQESMLKRRLCYPSLYEVSNWFKNVVVEHRRIKIISMQMRWKCYIKLDEIEIYLTFFSRFNAYSPLTKFSSRWSVSTHSPQYL